jgi:hypothetical protein
MNRTMIAAACALVLAFAPSALLAAEKAAAKTVAVKAGKGEKVCNYKFKSGEKRSWVCKKEEPCCAWDAISYVKCGSTITGCL